MHLSVGWSSIYLSIEYLNINVFVGRGLTVDDVLWRYSLFVGLVANFISLGGNKVYELRAAVHYQFPGVVGYPHVGQSFFDHFVDSCPGNGEVIVIPGRGSHRAKKYERKLGDKNALVS